MQNDGQSGSQWLENAHKFNRYTLIILLVISFALAGINQTWLAALLVGIPAAGIPLFLLASQGRSRITQHAIAIGFMLFTALHIHQMHGLIEMHFGIFVLMSFLAVYRNWQLFVTAFLVVAVHHIGFFVLQSMGVPVYLMQDDSLLFILLVVHAVYAGAQALMLGLNAYGSAKDMTTGIELEKCVARIMQDPDKITLQVRANNQINSSTLTSFNRLLDFFEALIEQVRAIADSVKNNAELNKTRIEALNTSKQKSQHEVAMIASASEQMSMSVKSMAEQANMVNGQAQDANKNTDEARTVVSRAQQDVQSLSGKIEQTATNVETLAQNCADISNVLETIKAIADQTNLLALNAAIEAARAGEQGRGFAVVADEVRQLASRTKTSTEEVSDIIEKLLSSSRLSSQSMNECMSLSSTTNEQAGRASGLMQDVQSIISTVYQTIEQLSHATQEQRNTGSMIADSTAQLKALTEAELGQIQTISNETRALAETVNQLQLQLSRLA